MTTALAEKQDQRLARPLKVLVPLIKDDLAHGRDAAERAGLPYYQAAGEKMLEAKSQLKHGEFQPWIKRNLGISYRQAWQYMKLAETTAGQKFGAANFSSLRDFARQTRHPDAEIVTRRRDEVERQTEREARRVLAMDLINSGYKLLARELHPDKGGSREAMARLNAVRSELRRLLAAASMGVVI